MDLPRYFIADLPPEAEVTPAMITEACETLRFNRDRYLAKRTTNEIVQTISELAREWQQSRNAFRRLALEHSPHATGFTPEIVAQGLDSLFAELTVDNLHSWLEQEFGHRDRIDDFVGSPPEKESKRAAMAIGPRLLVHVTSGNLPNSTILSIISGLLTRSAQFVKAGSTVSFLTRLFGHSLYEIDAKLGACLEIAAWPGGWQTLEAPLLSEPECITTTGDDATLQTIQAHLRPDQRFIGYGHRVSFAYITQKSLESSPKQRIVDAAAHDIAMWDQLGCLSPHIIYLEQGDALLPVKFAELLAEKLAGLEETHPRRPLSSQEAAQIRNARNFYEVRAAQLPGTAQWTSPESTAWTVTYEEDPRFQYSCLNRFIHVKPVANLDDLLKHAEAVQGKVSTVGLSAERTEYSPLAYQLAKWGATRICPLGRMQHPPLHWRHDGRPALGDLVDWCDLEAR